MGRCKISVGFVEGVVIVVLLMALVPSASAHFDTSGQYTHAGSGCPNNDRIDPINVVFYTWGTWGRAESQIQSHAGWFNSDGATQYFYDHSTCNVFHTQRASGTSSQTRYHVRVRGQHSDVTLGWTATGDAHHEDFVITCNFGLGGHAVDANGSSGSGFDQGRNQLRNVMSVAGHSWYSTWWGNTQSFTQCDGDVASSDGNVSFIQLHQVNH